MFPCDILHLSETMRPILKLFWAPDHFRLTSIRQDCRAAADLYMSSMQLDIDNKSHGCLQQLQEQQCQGKLPFWACFGQANQCAAHSHGVWRACIIYMMSGTTVRVASTSTVSRRGAILKCARIKQYSSTVHMLWHGIPMDSRPARHRMLLSLFSTWSVTRSKGCVWLTRITHFWILNACMNAGPASLHSASYSSNQARLLKVSHMSQASQLPSFCSTFSSFCHSHTEQTWS